VINQLRNNDGGGFDADFKGKVDPKWIDKTLRHLLTEASTVGLWSQ